MVMGMMREREGERAEEARAEIGGMAVVVVVGMVVETVAEVGVIEGQRLGVVAEVAGETRRESAGAVGVDNVYNLELYFVFQ